MMLVANLEWLRGQSGTVTVPTGEELSAYVPSASKWLMELRKTIPACGDARRIEVAVLAVLEGSSPDVRPDEVAAVAIVLMNERLSRFSEEMKANFQGPVNPETSTVEVRISAWMRSIDLGIAFLALRNAAGGKEKIGKAFSWGWMCKSGWFPMIDAIKNEMMRRNDW